jgi:glycerol-3-phosphate dehydrogenase
LTLAFVLSAASRGAVVANYVAATGFERSNGRVIGVKVRDMVPGGSSTPFTIAGRVIINAAGYGLRHLLPGTGAYGVGLDIKPSLALNLVIDRRFADVALALPSQPGPGKPSRLLFVTPWHTGSIIGTAHMPLVAHDGSGLATATQIDAFLAEINSALPGVVLTHDAIQLVHQGILPAWADSAETIRLVREGHIIDHAQHGMEDLLTILNVKYTTARLLAEQTIDAVGARLSIDKPCQTRTTPLWTGDLPTDYNSADNAAQSMLAGNDK